MPENERRDREDFVVESCLLTPRVRRAFEEMEIIQFEDLDPEAQDRELGR